LETASIAFVDGIAPLKGFAVSTLTVRNIEPAIKDKLRLVSAAHGRSMEEEVRCILRNVLSQPSVSTSGLGSRIHARFAALGGVELELPQRSDAPRAASFDAGTAA
jgi:plasmid stability protein